MGNCVHHVHHVAKDPQVAADFYITHFGRGLHHFGIQVDGLDAFAEKLEKAGVEFTKKPGPGVLGSKTSFIKAPDNVLIELVEEP